MGQATRKLTEAEKTSLNQLLDFLIAHRDGYFKDFEKSYVDEEFLIVDSDKVLKFLGKKKQNINFKNGFGKTPLFTAVCFGSEKLVKILIESGADINMTDDEGNTPIIAASSKGYEKIIRILIENGASVNQKNDVTTYTPLHYASYNGQKKAVDILIENGADVNATDKFFHSPIYYATKRNHLNVVAFLRRHNAT